MKESDAQNKYVEWYQRRSEDEKRLQYRAMKCEAGYFKDMSLEVLRRHLTSTATTGTGYIS